MILSTSLKCLQLRVSVITLRVCYYLQSIVNVGIDSMILQYNYALRSDFHMQNKNGFAQC